MHSSIAAELQRRMLIWDELRQNGGPTSVPPTLIKKLGIHRGQQGVFRDQSRTASISGDRAGIAVGVLQTGRIYTDALAEEGLTYHYPVTQRGTRDRNEVAALLACRTLELPIFVVITPYPKAPFRNVRLGWVQENDDVIGALLIAFSGNFPQCVRFDDQEFTLFALPRYRRATALARPYQWRFRFDVLRRYGSRCAICPISHPDLLEAAHIVPVADGGSDDPRNGIVFCHNHHRAFDAGLLAINPESLEVVSRFDYDSALGITHSRISHLVNKPHPDALLWAWNRFNAFVHPSVR